MVLLIAVGRRRLGPELSFTRQAAEGAFMAADEFAILGTEHALASYPDIEVGSVLKIFADIEVGQVLKIHREDLAGYPSEGETLGVLVLKPEEDRDGLRTATAPEDLGLMARFLADSPAAEGALALSVLDTAGWAVTCEVMVVQSAAQEE